MVWGVIFHDRPGPIYRVDHTMDSAAYVEILKKFITKVHPSQATSKKLIFQQDNAPCHTAAATMAYLNTTPIQFLKWPPLSPDLSPIENLWATLCRRVYHHEPRSLKDLWTTIQTEWSQLSANDITPLFNSMEARILSVIEVRGWHTKY